MFIMLLTVIRAVYYGCISISRIVYKLTSLYSFIKLYNFIIRSLALFALIKAPKPLFSLISNIILESWIYTIKISLRLIRMEKL
jgi:hypothetical protein